MRVLLGLLVFFIGFVSRPASAEPIAGADAPELREAALTWLERPTDFESVLAIAELAAGGNVAARRLVNQIYYQRWLDFPELDRAAFLARLPEDRTGRPRTLRPYSVDEDDIPALVALRRLGRTYDAGVWAALAQDVLDAGLGDRLRPHIWRALVHHPSIQVEAVWFAEEYFADDPHVQPHLWALYGAGDVVTELQARGAMPASRGLARWAIVRGSGEQARAFRQALDQDHWGALHTLGGLQRLLPEFPQDVAIDPMKRRMAELIAAPFTATAPAPEEIEKLAEIVRGNADRYPVFGTWQRICRDHCLDYEEICLAMSASLSGTSALEPERFSPITTELEYLQSGRAARELLTLIGGTASHDFGPDWMQLPQCLTQAAKAAAESVGYPSLR